MESGIHINRIEISETSFDNGVLKYYGYEELDEAFIGEIVKNKIVRCIQISRRLPAEAFSRIDKVLEKRPDLYFRIYGLYHEETFDLSCLHDMKHLKRQILDFSLKDRRNLCDFGILREIGDLKALRLSLFDLRDYCFLKELPEDMEELTVFADTINGGVSFDCSWLLRYEKLAKLYLGKKVKKNLQRIAELPLLKKLTLRGIKVNDLAFLKERGLEALALHWCGMNDLDSLRDFTSLRELELWRIMKLEDISFISTLSGLEKLSLIDLNHIHELPDLANLRALREIRLDNVPVDLEKVPDRYREMICR